MDADRPGERGPGAVYGWRFADRSLFVMIIEREILDLASKSSGAGRLRMRRWSTYEFNHEGTETRSL